MFAKQIVECYYMTAIAFYANQAPFKITVVKNAIMPWNEIAFEMEYVQKKNIFSFVEKRIL